MPRSPSRSRSRSRSPAPRRRSPTPDDKELSPFLIRIFVTKNKHTPLIDFDDAKFPVRDEYHVYGWKSSTPTSLIALLYPTFPAPYRSPLARFAFRHVYVDASQRGLYRSKDLCSFSGRDLMNTIMPKSTEGRNGSRAMDMELDDVEPAASTSGSGRKVTEKSLDEYGFITGDYLSVSLYVPEPKQSAPTRERDREPAPPLGRDARSGSGADGEWSKGEALPPRGGGRGSFQSRGGRERDGGYRDAPPLGVMGMGIRGGASRRSPSPRRNGYGARSRSPERRGSFNARRRDRSP